MHIYCSKKKLNLPNLAKVNSNLVIIQNDLYVASIDIGFFVNYCQNIKKTKPSGILFSNLVNTTSVFSNAFLFTMIINIVTFLKLIF